jgi:glutathione synthase
MYANNIVQCFPSPLPRARFEQALELQEIYNKLYCSIAEDEEWIYDTIKDMIAAEPLAKALWGIYEAAKDAGYVQDISAGVFRSDYMFHLTEAASVDRGGDLSKTTLKQVEFNSYSCSGLSHANKAANMHRYLARIGVYDMNEKPFPVDSLPINHNIDSVASILALAHKEYGPPKSKLASGTAILFIVQPYNVSPAHY